MTKKDFIYSKLMNYHCSCGLKRGLVTFSYFPPYNKILKVYRSYDGKTRKESFVSICSAVSCIYRNFCSFNF